MLTCCISRIDFVKFCAFEQKMEDVFRRKQDIEEKLLEEKQRSELIKESLSKADLLTNNMITILNQFDERLHKLEETILPVHRRTKDLQRLQDTIEKTTCALDHVLSYHHAAHDAGPVLRQGPNGKVEIFLKSMEKLDEAVLFFSENSPDSPELNTVKNLFTQGKNELDKEFKVLLSRHTKPFAVKKLAGQAKNESLSQDVFAYLSERTISDLSLIAQWLYGTGRSEGFLEVHAQTRSSNLVKALVGIKDEVRQASSNSGNRKQGSNTSTPRKSGARRVSQFTRKTSAMLRKESLQNISGLGGMSKSHPPIMEEESIEADVESFTTVLATCVQLLTIERSIVQLIIPERCRNKVFDLLATDSLKMLVQDGKKLIMFAEQCIERHDHPAVIGILPAMKQFKEVLPKYYDVLETPHIFFANAEFYSLGAAGIDQEVPNLKPFWRSKGVKEENRLKMHMVMGQLESVGVKVLEDFTDCVKSDPEKESHMPKDGIVHELTSNTMLFMQQLKQHQAAVGEMIASQQHDVNRAPDKARSCLSTYLSQVLAALKLNMENKSRVYQDDALAAVFLLNNYHFILDALNRHDLLVLIRLSTSEIEEIYKQFIAEQKRQYLRCWDKLCGYLSDEGKGTILNPQPGSKLKDKDKQIVKDKFKSFNNDFDELVKSHQQWAMPSVSVKKEIRGLVKDKVVPTYASFSDKYRMVQFTKNIEKYLKYTPDDVKQHLDLLFDQCSS